MSKIGPAKIIPVLGNEITYFDGDDDVDAATRIAHSEAQRINLTTVKLFEFLNNRIAAEIKRASNDFLVILSTGTLTLAEGNALQEVFKASKRNIDVLGPHLFLQWYDNTKGDPRRTNTLIRPELYTKRTYETMEVASKVEMPVVVMEWGESSWQVGNEGIGEFGQKFFIRVGENSFLAFAAGNSAKAFAKYPKVFIGHSYYSGPYPQAWQTVVTADPHAHPAERDLSFGEIVDAANPLVIRFKPAFYEIFMFNDLLERLAEEKKQFGYGSSV